VASGNAPKRQSKSRPTRPSARPSDPVADLRSELDAAQQHLREAAEREAAISEILRSISSSPTDVQPVLDVIAEHAVRYCNAEDAVVSLLESGALVAKAHVGPVPNMSPRSHLAVDRDTVTGHAFVDRRTIHVADQQNDPDHPVAREVAVHTTGHRTALGTPLLRQGEPIGVILLRRRVAQPFTPQQVKLVEAFATQAVIAIENVRLFHETKEALERQTAMSDVLSEMSRSAFDIGPVLQTVLDRAHRLSEADHGWLIRDVGDRHRLEAYRGNSDVMHGMLRDTDRDIVPRGWTKKAIAERRTQRVDDLTRQYTQFPLAPDEIAAVELRRKTHPEDPAPSSFSDITGAKKLLVVPLVRSETVLGVIVLTRTREEQFSERQVEIVETFAQQAAIAIENVRLFNETKEALERQTAISEILRIISASPTNVRPVLEAIAENALRFCAAEDALVVLPDGDDLRLAAHRGPVPVASDLRYPNDGTSMTSRAFIEARTIAVQDLQTAAEFPRGAEHARAVGHHAVVVAPLLRDGMSIGTINLRRFDTRPFSDREIAALETFAAQAVIAIENVRLFNETKESLDQQRAISDVLATISTAGSDLTPVFDTIVRHAAALCEAEYAILWRLDGDSGVVEARIGKHPYVPELGRRFELARLVPGRRVVGGTDIVHIPDLTRDPEADTDDSGGKTFPTRLGVAIRLDRALYGWMNLVRATVRPFSEREITLVKTFADQAAIAVQNARSLNETKEALERQTATGEVLKVISRSAFDLQRVLDTVIDSATKLTHASVGTIWRLEGEEYRAAASSVKVEDETMRETFRRLAIRPEEHDTALTRAALSRVPVQVEDVQTDPGYRSAVTRDISPRTLLAVPLLREGVPIGVLVIGRQQVSPFTEQEIELAANFADQAVIAIENTRLLSEIQDKSRQLEAASRHKSEFMANMSHELRTPLNAIIGFSDVLEQRLFGELNERQADYTHDIATSGRHLLELVNEILDLSKVEAGRMELEPTEFALADTIRGALAFVRERAATHAIELAADVPSDLGTVVADERKVRQVLLNLLSNAVKFTPDGGTIGVQAQRGDDQIQVSVRDTGIGIASADQAKVFDEFQQVGKTSDRSREGTGLGLTLAKRFIELHGGRIWVTSELGKGTTFTFAIPVERPATVVVR
jgi:signal transduction histidine kinase